MAFEFSSEQENKIIKAFNEEPYPVVYDLIYRMMSDPDDLNKPASTLGQEYYSTCEKGVCPLF